MTKSASDRSDLIAMKKCKEEKSRRHGNLETADPKKKDVITKARNKLLTLSDSLKTNKNIELPDHSKKNISKSMTQTTMDYFFKHFPPNKNHTYASGRGKGLKKQNSLGSYPIRIEITDEDNAIPSGTIDRMRPATVCVDKLDAPRDTEALALERPRKKLSFKVPEITGSAKKNKNSGDKSNSFNCISKLSLSVLESAGIPRNNSFNGVVRREDAWDDTELQV